MSSRTKNHKSKTSSNTVTKEPIKKIRATGRKIAQATSCKPINDPMQLRSPYTNWDINKLIILPPTQGESKNKKAKFFNGNFAYTYTLPDGNEQKGPLRIEFPEMISDSGVREVLEKADETGYRAPTDKYQIFCKMSLHEIPHITLRRILHEIYLKALAWMFDNGKKGTGVFPETYKMPTEGIREIDDDTDHLRHPTWWQETTVMEKGKPVKKKDETVPPTITMKVIMGTGRGASKFTDDATPLANIYKTEDLFDRGIKHIPEVIVGSVFVGGIKPKIQLIVKNSIVTDKMAPNTSTQAATIEERRANNTQTSQKVRDAMAEELLLNNLDDPLNGDGTGSGSGSSSKKSKGKDDASSSEDPPAKSKKSKVKPTTSSSESSGEPASSKKNVKGKKKPAKESNSSVEEPPKKNTKTQKKHVEASSSSVEEPVKASKKSTKIQKSTSTVESSGEEGQSKLKKEIPLAKNSKNTKVVTKVNVEEESESNKKSSSKKGKPTKADTDEDIEDESESSKKQSLKKTKPVKTDTEENSEDSE
jgi:hypothetical protein